MICPALSHIIHKLAQETDIALVQQRLCRAQIYNFCDKFISYQQIQLLDFTYKKGKNYFNINNFLRDPLQTVDTNQNKFVFQMIQNQSVRNRLRHQLNVQLTDSNVIENEHGNIMQSRIQRNETLSNSDMSIIYELGMLDNVDDNHGQNNSKEYLYQQNSIFQDDFHNQREYFYEKRNSPFNLQNKIKSYRQQLNAQNQYKNVNRINQIKNRTINTKTPPRNYYQPQNLRNTNNKPSTEIADIQQKISILPYQLQQKIKQNLQKKITALSKQEDKKQGSPRVQSKFLLPEFHKLSFEQQFLNQNENQLYPMDEKALNNYLSKQKFISVNRQPMQSPKNINKSIIIQQPLSMKQKSHSPHQNINTSLRRQKSHSRQNIIWNSIELKHSPSMLRAQSKSKQKQQSINKNKKVTEFIQKRKNQFSQFYNQTSKTPQKQFHPKQNLFQISQQFNKSKIIKFYTQILSSIPKCKKCSNLYGALTLYNQNVIYACNQCDLKNKLDRSVSFLSSNLGDEAFLSFKFNLQKESANYNHPIIGALFDLQNKLMNETEMKTYNSLIKQISTEIQKLEEIKRKLSKLHTIIEDLKNKVRTNPKCIFEAKNSLKKMFSPDFNTNNPINFRQEEKIKSIQHILPSQYLEELDLWCKIKAENYSMWPSIDQKLQVLCPLYMKKNIKTIRQFLDPLLHNFENNDVKISVSEGLKLPVKSLGSATFIVDGSYNISAFDHIQRLTLQFLNKRTFRQITSMMQNLPQTVQQIKVLYNHKLNSHISAQKYPILTKLASVRSCKNLYAMIQNCKDQQDLLSAMRVMTKKKQIKIQTTRSIYVRKPIIYATEQIKQMIKRLGKNIYLCQLNLSVGFEQNQVYRQLMITERNKLMYFSLNSTVINQNQQSNYPSQQRKEYDNLLSAFSSIKDKNNSNLNISNIWNENLAKEFFLKKLRKKLSTLAILKDSYREKQLIQKYKNQQVINVQNLKKRHQMNHTVRLQVLKMLL